MRISNKWLAILLALALPASGATVYCNNGCKVVSDPYVDATTPPPTGCKLYDGGAVVDTAPLVGGRCSFPRTFHPGDVVSLTMSYVWPQPPESGRSSPPYSPTFGAPPSAPTGHKLVTAITTPPVHKMSVLASDNFNRPDAGLGTNWRTIFSTHAPEVVSNALRPDLSSSECGALWDDGIVVWPNDQSSQLVVSPLGPATTTDTGGGPACRISGMIDKTGYVVSANTVETRIYKYVSGTKTQVGSDGVGGLAAGDVIALRCVGNSLTVTKNTVTIISATDSDIASGSAGFLISPNSVDWTSWDDWEGGSVDVVAGIFPPFMPGIADSRSPTNALLRM